MRIVQKAAFIGGLLISAIYFLYTLSFSTNWAIAEAFGTSFKEFFDSAQVFNQIIYGWGMRLVIVSGISLILFSHSNRHFSILNFGLAGYLAVCMIQSGIVTMNGLPGLKAAYLALDPLLLEMISAINYSEVSTQIFDIGNVLSILLFIQSATIIVVTIYKLVTQFKRDKQDFLLWIKKIFDRLKNHDNKGGAAGEVKP
jgi:hypothetical protein